MSSACFERQSSSLNWQAVEAVKTLNGQELAGRKLLVREDREDRDVKQYNKENGIEGTSPARPPRRTRRPPAATVTAAAGPSERTEATKSSGLQVMLLQCYDASEQGSILQQADSYNLPRAGTEALSALHCTPAQPFQWQTGSFTAARP